MKLKGIAVGTKMPPWVEVGVQEYAKRLPRDMPLEFIEIPIGNRAKNANLARAVKQESDQILAQVKPQDHVIALEVTGSNWSTEKLAKQMQNWQMQGQNIIFLIGGPDGLSDACRARANQQWSFSALTLPHPIVRIILSEQVYRAWSITQNHPYHRS
jgi:23S rRNA (pseudouridine1915-N3)-methyltransferase